MILFRQDTQKLSERQSRSLAGSASKMQEGVQQRTARDPNEGEKRYNRPLETAAKNITIYPY